MNTEEEIIKKIKEKKELSGISDSIVSDFLGDYKKKFRLSLENLSKTDIKIVVKEIRSDLRNLSGRFQKAFRKRKTSIIDMNKLLKTHSSTAERLGFYSKLKKIISKLNVTSILDLGCGLNPIALAGKKVTYFASDIREDELKIIEEHFKNNHFTGKTFVYDLRKISTDLPEADLCLIFKVLDILDKKNHSLAGKIISLVPCKLFLISFSTRKLSGRPMNNPRRIWFEKILARQNLSFKKINSPNEIFYLIEKLPNKQSRPT